MDVYDIIEQVLRDKKVTKKDLCSNIGISYHSLATLFARRTRSISFEIIVKIADYLDLSLYSFADVYIRTQEKTITNKDGSLLCADDAVLHDKDELMIRELSSILLKLPYRKRIKLMHYAYELSDH